jgi:hypothetical protein
MELPAHMFRPWRAYDAIRGWACLVGLVVLLYSCSYHQLGLELDPGSRHVNLVYY